MGLDSIFQTSLFIKHLQKYVVGKKIGRVKRSTDSRGLSMNTCVVRLPVRTQRLLAGTSTFAGLIRHDR